MAAPTAKPKVVVPAEEAVTQPPPPTPEPGTETEAPKRQVAFVKNTNPTEKMTFKDGSTFTFGGRALLITSDDELIGKIAEVMHGYGIVTQNGEKL